MLVDPLVRQVVDRIVAAPHPQRIILFGSRATGQARPDSDVDLLVVYSGTKSKREISLEIQRLFPWREFSLDLFVLTPEELAGYRHVANTLAREVTERGVVCYGRDPTSLPAV